jgi:hypothetical protein
MQVKSAVPIVILLAIGVLGCQDGSTTTPGPTATIDGPDALIADLRNAGADARLGERFAPDPFIAQGVVMCLGKEPIRLYVFPSIADRQQAAARIDPANPSNMGTAMVDWNGRPRFWQRDRVLVLYLGEEVATEALLRGVLGQPFAIGQGRPALRDDSCA